MLGRLLQELSWAGPTIRNFRDGGRGYENVLTAEALTGLDFLPRNSFLGAVLRAAKGADSARSTFVGEVEEAEITLLPDEIKLRPSAPAYQEQLVVQPDGIMTSPSCYVLIEAKRIRKSSFQPQQLAREYVSVLQNARRRTPLLLLLLGEDPPVTVKGHGRLGLEEAVSLHLPDVLSRADGQSLDQSSLMGGIHEVVSWTTWQQLGSVVNEQAALFRSEDPSVVGSVSRLADSVTQAIARHS